MRAHAACKARRDSPYWARTQVHEKAGRHRADRRRARSPRHDMPQSRQAAHDSAEQPSLFFPEATAEPATPQRAPALVQPAPLTASASIRACALPCADYLRRTDHSVYTVTCFLSDLPLLTEFLGRQTPLPAISRQMLADWLVHLRMDRGTRPAPKTMSRRVTFLKNFFGLLARESVLPGDLAADIALSRPLPPPPQL